LVLKVSPNYDPKKFDPNKKKKMNKKDYSNWSKEALPAKIKKVEEIYGIL
jgi:hypothetical protein